MGRSTKDEAPFAESLDAPLLKITSREAFTVRDAFTGVHVYGATGSGKTSGSGYALASAYLRAGWGGLVMCAKPEEVDYWVRLARQHGRLGSVIIFDENRSFNFMAYELARQGMAGIGNVVGCVEQIVEAADHAAGLHAGTGGDPFWTQAARSFLNHVIPVLYSAWGSVTVASIEDFLVSAATKKDQYNDPNWVPTSFAAKTLRKCKDDARVPMNERDLCRFFEFWFNQYPLIPEKTRGSVLVSLSSRLDRFKHGRMRSCFCEGTDIVPELAFHGGIILMAMPVLTWNEDGIVAQRTFKYQFQRAVESRNGLAPPHQRRPVFLWADEAQYFADPRDDQFLSTCRSSRAAVVYLTQNLPTYYARFGKDKTDMVDALVGKFATQVFHQNACNRTNTYASQLIGRTLHQRRNHSSSISMGRSLGMNAGTNSNSGSSTSYSRTVGGSPQQSSATYGGGHSESSGESLGRSVSESFNESTSSGMSEQMDHILEPNFFATKLKNGGTANGGMVSAVWFKAGGNFRSMGGGNILFPTFRQEQS